MIIWLASYPKSGNTWLRSIISSLIFSGNGKFNFDLIKNIPQFPVEKDFKEFTDNFKDIHEIKKYWILAQDKINLDRKIKFLKTHHINCKIEEFYFTNKSNTCATIYIVRDPRSLVSSISNHFDKSINEAKQFIMTPRLLGGNKDIKSGHVITLLGDWGEHYKFWKQNSENFLLIKYEDLLKNVDKELEKIITFLKKYTIFEASEKKKQNIIKTTNFNSLKKMEEDGFFKENVFKKSLDKRINFFHQGPENRWENVLDNRIREEIEKKFKDEMKELGYL